jgi:ABC-2 type transport system ATP-binding protein
LEFDIPYGVADGVSAQAAIEVDNISKSYKDKLALDEVSLSVPRGTIFGLLGPNGAGKTTLVKVLTTLIVPDKGKALVNGIDVARQAQRVRFEIGLAGQYAAVDENLTGYENLVMVGRLYHLGRSESKRRASQLLETFTLSDAADRQVRQYSGGMRRRLDLAAALVAKPKILFLDEPTTGLDPRSRNELWDIVERLADSGSTVLLTTQYLEEADRLASQLAVIDRGKIIASGTPQEIKSLVGSSVVAVTLTSREAMESAVRLLHSLGLKDTHVEADQNRVRAASNDKKGVLAEVVRALDDHNLEIAEISLEGPTLDDAFLALTGHGVADADS